MKKLDAFAIKEFEEGGQSQGQPPLI